MVSNRKEIRRRNPAILKIFNDVERLNKCHYCNHSLQFIVHKLFMPSLSQKYLAFQQKSDIRRTKNITPAQRTARCEAPRPQGGASRQGWFGGLTMTKKDSSLSPYPFEGVPVLSLSKDAP